VCGCFRSYFQIDCTSIIHSYCIDYISLQTFGGVMATLTVKESNALVPSRWLGLGRRITGLCVAETLLSGLTCCAVPLLLLLIYGLNTTMHITSILAVLVIAKGLE
jgi:hypothetical protein